MHVRLIPAFCLLGLITGCAGQSSVRPTEALDERTGVTVGALKEPIELLPGTQDSTAMMHKRASFAYLGPVEWNRSGDFSYALWVHVVPGNGAQPGDIHAPDGLVLILDDGPLPLTPTEAPKLGREPYKRVASWGQTGYFGCDVATLKRMASSTKLELDVRAGDGSVIAFVPVLDARSALTQYLKDRGITGD